MDKQIIFSYADQNRYYKCLARQKKSINFFWNGDYLPVTPSEGYRYWEKGQEVVGLPTVGYRYTGPSHRVLHCGFKAHIMRDLMRDPMLYDQVLYIDSSLWATNPVQPIFDKIKKNGYYFLDNAGIICGEWLSDTALTIMGKTRDEIMEIPSISGGCFGLDFTSKIGLDLFKRIWEWREAWHCPENSLDGDNRIRTNENNVASQDPRCHGHRMQAVVSVAAWEAGAKEWGHLEAQHSDVEVPGTDVVYWKPGMKNDWKDAIFLANGM